MRVRAQRRPGGEETPGSLSPTLHHWLTAEPVEGRTVLDVGTGTGLLARTLAGRARRVIGIDVDAGALLEARRLARRGGLGSVVFVVADAEAADYRALGPIDMIVAHRCLSDAIVARAGEALPPGGVLAFAAFHVDQWLETGRVSRFAYDEERARAVLGASGFRVERLAVEREIQRFASADEALAATRAFRPRWEADGRWATWSRFVGGGGRTLTHSSLVVLARRLAGGS